MPKPPQAVLLVIVLFLLAQMIIIFHSVAVRFGKNGELDTWNYNPFHSKNELLIDDLAMSKCSIKLLLTRVGLVNRSEATVKIGFVDTVNRLTALVINLETNTV